MHVTNCEHGGVRPKGLNTPAHLSVASFRRVAAFRRRTDRFYEKSAERTYRCVASHVASKRCCVILTQRRESLQERFFSTRRRTFKFPTNHLAVSPSLSVSQN